MILVTGGRGAGKRTFVTDVLGFSPEQFAEDGPVLYGLESMDPLPSLETLLDREVVVCREVGCGVVPMDRGDRDWREAVGRLCCALALEAEAVYRLQCGLAMRLK